MIIDQLSVKLLNRPGEMSKISDLLGDDGVNIKALTAAVHGDNAQVQLVVDDVKKALEALKAGGFDVHLHQVIAVETPDHPGGLNAILRPLKQANVNVVFLYPLIGKHHGNAVLILGAEPIETAISALQKQYITILDRELYAL